MTTVTLLPLGTYPAQTTSFQAAIPAGTTGATLAIHAPLQTLFQYSLEFSLSRDGGATWVWATATACRCRATDTTVQLDTVGYNRVKADVVLVTALQVRVTLATTP